MDQDMLSKMVLPVLAAGVVLAVYNRLLRKTGNKSELKQRLIASSIRYEMNKVR